jgi:hypothetical protein
MGGLQQPTMQAPGHQQIRPLAQPAIYKLRMLAKPLRLLGLRVASAEAAVESAVHPGHPQRHVRLTLHLGPLIFQCCQCARWEQGRGGLGFTMQESFNQSVSSAPPTLKPHINPL